MILRAPALVCPRKVGGWKRPLDFGYNFRDVQGLGAYVDGIAQMLPAGVDINPFPQYNGLASDPGLMHVGRYTPPTRCAIYWSVGGSNSNKNKLETDCDLRGEGGNTLHDVNAGYTSNSVFRALGTAMTLDVSDFDILTGYYIFEITSMRGCVARITEYEGGADGIVNLTMTGDAVGAAVARRLSDNSDQILTTGQAYLKAGRNLLKVAFTTGAGTRTALVFEIMFDFEVPYGL